MANRQNPCNDTVFPFRARPRVGSPPFDGIAPKTDLTATLKSCLMKRMRPSVETSIESDAIAVERTLAGDREAFRILVERHSRNVYRLAYRMTRNQHDAEEGVQEAVFRAYQKLNQFRLRPKFG